MAQKGGETMQKSNTKVIALSNQKGGVGKTTTCLNPDVVVWKNTDVGVDLIPSSIRYAHMEMVLADENPHTRNSLLKQYLDTLKSDYDYILIDCPPSLGILSINCLSAADKVIVPTITDYTSVQGVELLIDTLKRVKNNTNRTLSLWVYCPQWLITG